MRVVSIAGDHCNCGKVKVFKVTIFNRRGRRVRREFISFQINAKAGFLSDGLKPTDTATWGGLLTVVSGVNIGKSLKESALVRNEGYPPRALRLKILTLGAYLPMQKLEKIRFRMSSAVVSPVIESSGRNA